MLPPDGEVGVSILDSQGAGNRLVSEESAEYTQFSLQICDLISDVILGPKALNDSQVVPNIIKYEPIA